LAVDDQPINRSILVADESARYLPPAGEVIGEDSFSPEELSFSATPADDLGGAYEPTPSIPEDQRLFEASGPSVAVSTSGPRTAVVGKPSVYTVNVVNMSQVGAKNLSVNVVLPSWAEIGDLKSTIGTALPQQDRAVAGESEGNAVWKISELAAGQTGQLRLTVIPRQNRPIDLMVRWNVAPIVSSAQIEVLQPRLEMSLAGPTDVQYGDTKIYKIQLVNSGTGDAENVVIRLSPTSPGQQPSEAPIGLLAAGEKKTIEIELTAQQAGILEIHAEATADGGLTAQVDEQVMVRRAKLAAALQGPAVKYAGTVATYRMQLGNTGDALADKVAATLTLPAGSKFISATPNAEFDEQTSAVRWSLDPVQASGRLELEVKCVLMTAGINEIRFSAEAAGDVVVSKAGNTQVEALADLKLIINDPTGPIAVGEEAVYEVHIINRGTKAARDINAVAFFSPGIEPTSVTGGKGTVQPGQIVFDPINRLEAGQEIVFKITARAQLAKNHVFRVEIDCTDPETRLVNEETTRFYSAAPAGSGATPSPGRRSYAGEPDRM